MKQIELLGKRIRIRRAALEDADASFRWFSDPLVTEFLPLAGGPGLPMERIVAFLAAASRDDSPDLSVGIDDLRSGRTIGCGGLRNIVPMDSAEVSVVIGERELWGLGYGHEAMDLLLQIGFTDLNLRTIWLIVREDNVRAVRLFSRLGFVTTEMLQAAAIVNGVPRNKLRMQVSAAAWRAQRNAG
jgi:RimJ/RimL family protein N-acetyltransferase